jgi:hypothetical protein
VRVKSYIEKIRDECYKAKREDEDILIAAILYTSVTDSRYTDNKKELEHRQILSGSIDQIGNDL